MFDLLVDPSSYRILSQNPCSKIIKQVKTLLSKSSFDDATRKKLVPSKEVTPRIYGVPKIHKEGIPLRPIVDTMGSPTYFLASHLAKIISPLVGKSDSFVKDSCHFVQFIKGNFVDSDDILVSFDVVSLFTKVPIPDSIQIVKCQVCAEIAELVELCLRSTFFSFHNVIYEQVDGVAMGSPHSPVIANLYMEHFEEMASNPSPSNPGGGSDMLMKPMFVGHMDLTNLKSFTSTSTIWPPTFPSPRRLSQTTNYPSKWKGAFNIINNVYHYLSYCKIMTFQ